MLHRIIGAIIAVIGVVLLFVFRTVLFPLLLIVSGVLWFVASRQKRDQLLKWARIGTVLFGIGTLIVIGTNLFSSAEADDSDSEELDYFEQKEAALDEDARQREEAYFNLTSINGTTVVQNDIRNDVNHDLGEFSEKGIEYLKENGDDEFDNMGGIIFSRVQPLTNEEDEDVMMNGVLVYYSQLTLDDMDFESLTATPTSLFEHADNVYIHEDLRDHESYQSYIEFTEKDLPSSEMARLQNQEYFE